VQLTTDGGQQWETLDGPWPKQKWVSRVICSTHDKNTLYVSLNGYRNDDFTAYAYKSTDLGKSWIPIHQGVTNVPINTMAEHPKNPKELYIGTDHGTYRSIDQGQSFDVLPHLPPVAVHDLKIQPEANHLLIGTHGRSIYQVDLDELVLSNEALAIKEVQKVNIVTIGEINLRLGETPINQTYL
jgi:hypothetical protein